MTTTAARAALAAAVVALAVAAGLLPGPAAGAADLPDRPGRVLVVSMPGVTWADVQGRGLTTLESFLADAAMADMAPRGVSPRSTPGAAYLTMSAGTRATSEDSIDGQVLAVEEESSGSAAGEIFARRTGITPEGPFVSLVWPSLLRANAPQPYDAELGLLTETLQGASVRVAAIGNADGTESIGPSYERQVGLALADADGVVPGGHLGKDLLVADPSQPFGLRLDVDVVEERFASEWRAASPGGERGGGVVLVEASDNARLLRYRTTVDSGRYATLWDQALRRADELLARLLAHVDPETDTVIVLAPYNRRGDRDLTITAMAGPDVEPGYLRSASTQRAGFLTLVDVAPTILDVLGVDRPTEMEGRPALVTPSDASVEERIEHLVSLNAASRFRERLLTPTTTAVLLVLAATVAAAMVAHTSGWSPRARAAIRFAALFDLAVLPVSYLARGFPLEDLGARFYWSFVVLAALAVAAAATALARWRGARRGALVGVLALVAGVLVVDVVTGSRLSLSAAFGYSPTGNSRLYGISNYSYGQVAAATCLLAAWIADVRPGRTGRLLAVGAMAAAVVLLGVPIWGSDVGGVLAFTPAVVVFAVVLHRWRIRLPLVLAAGALTVLAIVVFGLLDLARPAGDRAHLGRLFERVGNEGLEPLVSVIERKLLANLAVSTSSLWVAAIPIAVAFWVYLRRGPGRPAEGIRDRFATLPAALWAVLVAAVLGSALNDSGAIVGGVASMVVTASLVVLLLGPDPIPGVVARPGQGERTAESPADPAEGDDAGGAGGPPAPVRGDALAPG